MRASRWENTHHMSLIAVFPLLHFTAVFGGHIRQNARFCLFPTTGSLSNYYTSFWNYKTVPNKCVPWTHLGPFESKNHWQDAAYFPQFANLLCDSGSHPSWNRIRLKSNGQDLATLHLDHITALLSIFGGPHLRPHPPRGSLDKIFSTCFP